MSKVSLLDKEAKASDWIASNFWVPELKGPIWLAPYHIQTLDMALEKDENGDFRHALILWSDVKKSIKCLGKHTLLWMYDNSYKHAGEIVVGDEVYGYTPDGFVRDVVSGVELQEPDTVYEIVTYRGNRLVVTGEHGLLVCAGQNSFWINAKVAYVGMQIICVDDYIVSRDRIVSIKKLPPEETVAIEVEKTHTHVTNGIVTHNSTIAAGVALWRAFQLEWGSIKVVANDLKQAQSRSYFYLVRSLQLNPETANMIETGEIKITKYTIDLNFNHTKIEAIPADPKGEAGGNDDMVLFTELWTYMQDAHIQLWSETVVPPNKYGQSFRWAESYAGYTGQSKILEDLYTANVKDEYRLKGTIAPLYRNGGTFVMWNHTPRLPWESEEYYRQQRSEISDEEFRRIHRNEWVGSVTTFVPAAWWDNCKTEPVVRTDTEQESVIVAADAAYASGGDMFSIVVVGKHGNGDKIAVKEARFWRAGKNGKLDFKNVNNESDPNYPYGYVMELAKRYRVLEVAYDPYQLHLMATEQNKKRVAFWKEFAQSKARTVADNALYDAIRDGSIVYTDRVVGIDELSQHIKNAGRDNSGRLVKLHKEQKIDGAVALAMAHSRARYYRL